MIKRVCIGDLNIGLLVSDSAAANKDVGRAGLKRAVVALVAIDPGGDAILFVSPDDHAVARDGYLFSK